MYHADGGYALITGGAGGIGKSTAKQMAQKGINLFLIDFDEKLLLETEKEFRSTFPKIDVKTKEMDFKRRIYKSYYSM